jgi:hypothetical protein
LNLSCMGIQYLVLIFWKVDVTETTITHQINSRRYVPNSKR